MEMRLRSPPLCQLKVSFWKKFELNKVELDSFFLPHGAEPYVFIFIFHAHYGQHLKPNKPTGLTRFKRHILKSIKDLRCFLSSLMRVYTSTEEGEGCRSNER